MFVSHRKHAWCYEVDYDEDRLVDRFSTENEHSAKNQFAIEFPSPHYEPVCSRAGKGVEDCI